MSDERTKTIVDSLRYMSGMEARLINSCLLSDAADIIERLAAPPAGWKCRNCDQSEGAGYCSACADEMVHRDAAGDVETGTVLGFLNRAARKPTEWWDFEREGQPTVAGVLAALMIYAVQDRAALEGK